MGTLREELEAKADELGMGDSGESTVVPPVPEAHSEPVEAATDPTEETEAPDETTVTARQRDNSGRFSKTATPAPPRTAPPLTRPPLPGARPTPHPVAAPPAPVPSRAPQSWKPVLREKFGTLPPEFQEEAVRLDREYQKIQRENAQLRQTSQAGNPYQEVLRPYEASIRASGMEATKYIGGLMNAVHTMEYGPPQAKADVIAAMVAQYGADLLRPDSQDGTGPLDRAIAARLQGRPAQQGQHQGPYQDPRVDKLFSALEGRQKQMEAQAEAEQNERVEKMMADPKFEFLSDVANEMQHVILVWKQQGKKQVSDADLEKAYHLACSMNADVSPVYEQRREAEQAKKAMASTERARIAASSPRSQPTGMPATQPKGLRAALEAKADEIGLR